jgi:hypothetical protein
MNAFDTDFIILADRVTGSIIYQAQTSTRGKILPQTLLLMAIPSTCFLLIASTSGQRVGNERLDITRFPTYCGACSDPNHVRSTFKAPNDSDVLRWTMAKRKQIAEKYAGQPPPTPHLSDVPVDLAQL